MSLQSILDQLLKSGTAQVQKTRESGDLHKYATGAAAGGALALLLGSKRGRSLGGSALKLGGVAAIGALAWKLVQEHQARQAAQVSQPVPGVPAMPAPSFERLSAPQLEDHSRAMLKAVIAAAKADGHMDDRERAAVEAELHRMDADDSTRRWVDQELRRPVEPAEVAGAATTPEMAAEVYLASVLVADDTSTMERAYLDALARELKLAPELKASLEARAKAG
jgi:uncharacterized membrane protein YebE (DUF533 family)